MAAAIPVLPDAAAAVQWLRQRVPATAALRADHRRVTAGDVFLAWPGRQADARRHALAALQAGAAAVLMEAAGAEDLPELHASAAAGHDAADLRARVARLPGLKAAAGLIADAWLGQPSARLQLLAVTGTNGKTSTACWLGQALAAAGRRCGVVGTLGIGLGDVPPAQWQATGLTSPDALTLHAALHGFAEQGCSACAIEASSIGLADERLAGVRIAVALFTNFTRDHLDWHGDMAAYWAAKRRLFDWPGLQAAVVNIDDARGAELAAELQPRAAIGALDLWSVSRAPSGADAAPARLQARALRYTAQGLAFELAEPGGTTPAVTVQTHLLGDYNASNLLGVAAGLRACGLSLAEAAAALQTLQPVPGRLEPVRVPGADVEVLVDYAHTPDALEQALRALQPLARARGGRLVCLFGCGGNRDASKRPLMGAIAEREADAVVLTSDNPRLEDPLAILAQVRAGLQRADAAQVQPERSVAVDNAIAQAQPGDVLLLAGKGHEDYQDIAGSKRPYSDLLQAQAALQRRVQAQRQAVRQAHGVCP